MLTASTSRAEKYPRFRSAARSCFSRTSRVPPVGGIEQLAPAIIASGDVRRDEHRAATRDTRLDAERRLAPRHVFRPAHLVDARERPLANLVDEALEQGALALDLDENASGAVANKSGQAETARKTVDEGAEPYSLNDPFDGDRASCEDARRHVPRFTQSVTNGKRRTSIEQAGRQVPFPQIFARETDSREFVTVSIR